MIPQMICVGHDQHTTESQTKRRFADEEKIIEKALIDSWLIK